MFLIIYACPHVEYSCGIKFVLLFQVLSSKLGGAQHILDAMASQRSKWKERLTDISSRIDSVPGHAMLCAAGVCYLARSPPGKHRAILSNWLGFCSGVVPLGSATLEQSKIQSTQVRTCFGCMFEYCAVPVAHEL